MKNKSERAIEHTPTVAGPSSLGTSSKAAGISSNDIEASPTAPTTGWDRVKALYTSPFSMETDVVKRVGRMSFFGGFIIGGASGFAEASRQYATANVGRTYLSKSDAVKRRTDYAIVRFAMRGFSVGFKCAFLSGALVLLATHTAAFRQRFSSLYLPAYSVLVGGAFTFPLGFIGMAQAIGLGITSGLTLSAVVQLYALSMDKTADEAYWHFKRKYESFVIEDLDFETKVQEVMREQKLWRYQAERIVKEDIDREFLGDESESSQ